MESDQRYYRRRAYEELAAAARAVTPAARERRESLARAFFDRLTDAGGADRAFHPSTAPAAHSVEGA